MKHLIVRNSHLTITLALALQAGAGCAFMQYRSSDGERFSRWALGTRTAVSSLAVQTHTNGSRTIEVRGVNSDSATALGTVTEAAVRAALNNVR